VNQLIMSKSYLLPRACLPGKVSRSILFSICGLFLGILSCVAAEAVVDIKPLRVPSPGSAVDGSYLPQPILPGGIVVPLFPANSPYLKADRIAEPEKYNMTRGTPGRIQSIVNIHNPSIEVHTVGPNINTGSVILLLAGGGHRTLNVGTESSDFVPYFYNYGVNSVIVRNRLRSDGYDAKVDAVKDAQQAIRMVRAHALEWGFDPNKIGIMGFSAGAEIAAATAIDYEVFDKEHSGAGDPLADVSSRPNFVGLLYPGPTPFTFEPERVFPRSAPPVFIATAGSGDRIHAIWANQYFTPMLNAGIPNIEMHIYGNGAHAGGLKDRGNTPFGTWQDRFIEWYRDLGFLAKSGVETKAEKDSAAFVTKPPRQRRGRPQGSRGNRPNALPPARGSQ
jgi:acetyl esterase/lipase